MSLPIKYFFRVCIVIVAFCGLMLAFFAETVTAHSEKQPDFGFSIEGWKGFVQEPIALFRLEKPSEFQKITMKEQYNLVNELIELQQTVMTQTSIDDHFSEKIQRLCEGFPNTDSTKANTFRSRRTSIAYYHMYTPRYMESVTSRVDPDMLRDFDGLLTNVEASILDDFINRFMFRIETWRKKIDTQANVGAGGVRKEAGLTYLKDLQKYLQVWHQLRDEVNIHIEASRDVEARRKATLLKWELFAKQKLPMLQRSMNKAIALRTDPANSHYFYLGGKSLKKDEMIVVRLVLGDENLFFDASASNEQQLTGFKLIEF